MTEGKKRKQSEGRKQFSEPDSDMIDILDIRQRMEINMINMFRALIEKVDHIQEHMGNISREMETVRKDSKAMVEIKNTVSERRMLLMSSPGD